MSRFRPAGIAPVNLDGQADGDIIQNDSGIWKPAKLPGELLARVEVENDTFTDATFNTATDTITKAGHGLANGDRVALLPVPTVADYDLSAIPTGLIWSRAYYVVGVSVDDFQVSLTSGGAAETFSTAGDGSKIKIDKLTVGSVLITDFEAERVSFRIYGNIIPRPSDGRNRLGIRINGVTANVYGWDVNISYVLNVTSNFQTLSTVMGFDIWCKNNRAYMVDSLLSVFYYVAVSDLTTLLHITRPLTAAPATRGGQTLPDAVFGDAVNSLTLIPTDFFADGTILEVWRS